VDLLYSLLCKHNKSNKLEFEFNTSIAAIGVDLAGILGDAWRGPKVDWCRVG